MSDDFDLGSAPNEKLALARKWRPMSFSQVVGQSNEVKTLQRALATNRLHHAYMFTGTRGVGKTTIARILAKSFNCDNLSKEGEACGHCDSCKQIDTSQHPDVFEMDAASTTQVDRMREVLETTNYAPLSGKYKVYIIDEVHMLSKAAFNAMLKTLEEPPEHVKFILATTDPQLVPPTVHSRCLRFSLKRLDVDSITNHLCFVLDEEKIDYEKEAIAIIAKQAGGSVRDALSILDEAILMSDKISQVGVRNLLGLAGADIASQILEYIVNDDTTKLIELADDLYAKGTDLENVLNDLIELIHKVQLATLTPKLQKPEFAKFKKLVSVDIQLIYEIATHGRKQILLANDVKIAFDMTIMRICVFLKSQQNSNVQAASNTSTNVVTNTKTTTPNQNQETSTVDINKIPTTEEEWEAFCLSIDIKVKNFASSCIFESYIDNKLVLITKQASAREEDLLKKELVKKFPAIREIIIFKSSEKLKKKTPAEHQAENKSKKEAALIEEFEKSDIMQEIRDKFPDSVIEKDQVDISKS